LMARLLGVLPIYTGIAQDYVYRGAGAVKRFTDAAVKPVFWIEEINANLRSFFGTISKPKSTTDKHG